MALGFNFKNHDYSLVKKNKPQATVLVLWHKVLALF